MTPSAVEPKPGVNVGRVVVNVVVRNGDDVARAQRGEVTPEQIRTLAIEALVDTGATFFCLPQSLVDQLGLSRFRERETRTISGRIMMRVYEPVEIEVQGRACSTEVMALPDERQCLLGQIPLESLDWWVDPQGRRLVGNPEHDGEWMAEAF